MERGYIMRTQDYLKIIHEDIHSVVVATLDNDGRPVTRVIDMMLHDENMCHVRFRLHRPA